MLPEHHGIAHPTHKLRWRMFDKNTNLKYTYQEIWNTHSFVVSLLIELFDYDEKKFSQLIDKSVTLSPVDRNKLLEWANTVCSKVEQKEYLTWHTIRKILHHHRSYPKADWALPEEELKKYEDLYFKLKPADTLNQYIWLFNDHWPKLPEGFIYDSDSNGKQYEQHQAQIDNVRIEGLKAILNEYGINKIKDLYKSVKQPWILGATLAKIISDEKDIIFISQVLNDQLLNDEDKHIDFFYGFIYEKSTIEVFEWIKSLFFTLSEKGFSEKALAHLLIPLNQTNQLWEFIDSQNEEIQNEYWLKMRPHFFHSTKEEKISSMHRS